ncbi:unnamed protein product [Cyprideis torosa]|uniref:Uncharacterized protein n=1 Tax=Cyprideis torosa TaxID=163714 RepID=A0A7R8WR15_9CRUS|nr:unnamed protein product [Cyprideis torosa]CAG0908440.1 unnamed protein product [Cyprideis torosa]
MPCFFSGLLWVSCTYVLWVCFDFPALGQLMEALLLEVVACQIKSEAVVPVLVQLVGYCPLLREILVDAISVVECKISLTEDKDQKSRLIAFLNESQSVS